MGCLYIEECKESFHNIQTCGNPNVWRKCKTYKNKYFYKDLLEVLANTQGFDGTINDLKKMERVEELYKLVEYDENSVEFEVRVQSPKFVYAFSIHDAHNYFNEKKEYPDYEDQVFTGKWRKLE